MASPNPRSDRPGGEPPDPDAVAVDALPDEVRLHGDGDETEQSQRTAGGPEPESDEEGSDDTAQR